MSGDVQLNGVEISISATDVPADELEAFVSKIAWATFSFDDRSAWDPIMTAEYARPVQDASESP